MDTAGSGRRLPDRDRERHRTTELRAQTVGGAVKLALDLAVKKRMGVYVMKDNEYGGFKAATFCDDDPNAVLGVAQPDGSFHGV